MAKAKIVTPESKISIKDNSASKTIETTVAYDGPVFLIAAPSSKGIEDMQVIEPSTEGITFFNKYGKKPSFVKYGQELLTAAILAQKEAKIIFKRIVAPNSTLANIVIYGQIITSQVQKTNTDGYSLFVDTLTGEETIISEGNKPLMDTIVKLKYTGKSFSNIKNIKELSTIVKSTLDEENKIYPLFVIVDNGRGESLKRIRISSDYTVSKRLSYMKYSLEVIESSEVLETLNFTSNADIEEYEKNMSIKTVITQYSEQIKCDLFESYWEMMAEELSKLTGLDFEYLMNVDLFNCKDRTGVPLTGLSLDKSTGYANLSYAFGLTLDNGTNGSFGSFPINTDSYKDELVKFFTGQLTTDIYDIDNFKIDLIPDAAYPLPVKKAITNLVSFRLDPFYFRDMGILDNTNYSDIIGEGETYLSNDQNTMFSATYPLYYDIIDPFSKKQITVTSVLELCENALVHFKNSRSCPFAGLKFGIKFPRCILGTENFRPINLPEVKQRDNFIDIRLNYAVKYDEVLVQDTEITSYDDITEASYISNIFNLQKVIKDIRTLCPSTRYTFIEEKDLEDYQETIENRVLSKNRANFVKLELVYLQDATAKQNKVFLAALNVEFKDFVAQEQFQIYLTNGN